MLAASNALGEHVSGPQQLRGCRLNSQNLPDLQQLLTVFAILLEDSGGSPPPPQFGSWETVPALRNPSCRRVKVPALGDLACSKGR